MDRDEKFLVGVLIFCAVISFVAMLESSFRLGKVKSDLAELEKIDVCINQANEIGLDPNQKQRSDFIKTCYEGQNE